jgi:anti-anti-sigma factor
MDIQKTRTEEGVEVAISGRLDAHGAGHLESELEDALRAGEHRIDLLMKDVSFISSAGLRVLIKYYQKLQQLGGRLSAKEPSQACLSVLRLTGLTDLLTRPEAPASPAASVEAAVAAPQERHSPGLDCLVYSVAPGGSLRCQLTGDPSGLDSFQLPDAGVRSVSLPVDALSVGIGALGDDPGECRARMGEFLAAGGAAVCLPSDTGVPDYMTATHEFVPQVQALYAVSAHGQMSHCIRFSSSNGPAALSSLVDMSLDSLSADTIGLAMIAETAGLIGASLCRSPMLGDSSERLFDHPGIRRWLSFTPEHVFDRSVALVVGIASKAVPGDLGVHLRPLATGAGALGHFHAAVFSFRAMRKGLIQLEQEVAALFEEKSLQAVMHLVNDNRDIVGAGESLFVQGALWCAPVVSFSKEEL